MTGRKLIIIGLVVILGATAYLTVMAFDRYAQLTNTVVQSDTEITAIAETHAQATSSAPSLAGIPYGDSRDVLLHDANLVRINIGEEPLTRNADLDTAAAAKLEDMKDRGYFDHVYAGTYYFDFIDRTNYNRGWSGENLARGYNSANDVFAAWMASPLHHANIVDADYVDTGIATDGDYYVQMFANPLTF